MLFDNWMGIVRVFMVGVLSYVALVILLRFSGKRTLSKMNAFDLVVSVALGSTLATVLLSDRVAYLEGLAAFTVLIGMQFVVAFFSSRSKMVDSIVKSELRMLMYKGEFLEEALKEERVVKSEVMQAVRSSGYASLQQAEAVILETDGSFTVIGSSGQGDMSALSNVRKSRGGNYA